MYGGSEIAKPEISLPDPEEPKIYIDHYQKLRIKLNAYFMPKKNKYYARYVFLKTMPKAGEAFASLVIQKIKE